MEFLLKAQFSCLFDPLAQQSLTVIQKSHGKV